MEKRVFRLSLHTRLVLITTAVLLVAPWPLFAWLEWDDSLTGLWFGHKLTNALFMSVTARTAGFNTVDYGQASEAGNFLTILLMAIGGSPGGTAGGLKTTTFALLGILAWSRYRGQAVVCVWGRSLRKETTDRAVGLFVITFAVITAGILALTVTERGSALFQYAVLVPTVDFQRLEEVLLLTGHTAVDLAAHFPGAG